MPPDSGDLNEQLEFEERMRAMSEDDRSIFIAKQTYALTNKVDALSNKLETLGNGGTSKKMVATTSGITTASIVAIVEALRVLISR